ncbi:hypothetical protein LBWT_X4550 (plasmid) [Leptolyngbya boryana IAM M-101]|nr:hypothetical protein LBWT_X4550 [Leptolyngbya boryana IAM M-101]BAS66731.1 hypothetical protein LBDG_X4550 [Leptolyngbya boryana dg5]
MYVRADSEHFDPDSNGNGGWVWTLVRDRISALLLEEHRCIFMDAISNS